MPGPVMEFLKMNVIPQHGGIAQLVRAKDS